MGASELQNPVHEILEEQETSSEYLLGETSDTEGANINSGATINLVLLYRCFLLFLCIVGIAFLLLAAYPA